MNGEPWGTPSALDEIGLSFVAINDLPEVVVVGTFRFYWTDG